jgi:hypothetical protein
MRIESERKLFIGLRVDNKLRDQLNMCPPRDKAYFDGSNPDYLTIMRSAQDIFVGKIIDAGTAAISMDDLKRNLLSILTRIAPGRHREDSVKVFALDDADPPPDAPTLERPRRPEDEAGGY